MISPSATLADAAATAVGNLVKQKGDIQQGLDFARSVPGINGVLIIKDDKLGLWGEVKICPTD